MKKIYFLLLAFFLFSCANAQIINFPDGNFHHKLLRPNQYGAQAYIDPMTGMANQIPYPLARDVNNNPMVIDQNNDGYIQQNEALNVYYLDVSQLAGLPMQFVNINEPISNLTGIEYFTNLRYLSCSSNSLTSLPISNNLNLTGLYCDHNQLTGINVSQLLNLRSLNCSNNHISTINVSTNVLLESLYADSNLLSTINLNQNTALTSLSLGGNAISNIDLSQNTALTHLTLIENLLTSVNLSQNTQLTYLAVNTNQISNLDISHQLLLSELHCDNNPITNLDLTHNHLLNSLSCSSNQLTTLNLTQNPILNSLSCSGNQLSTLNLTQNPSLGGLYCGNNQLSTIDLSQNFNLHDLNCNDNSLLTYLNVKNGINTSIVFQGTPNLRYICSDDVELTAIQNLITQYGYTNCNVNSYCSFTPGGTFYTIQGNNKFDENNNGCDALDLGLPNLKFNIANGANSGSLVADISGNYNIPVIAGTHTITPVLENPTYFNVSPSSVNVTFPTHASPFTQNFCVSANGVHPDLEVSLLPIMSVRPGFDASYKLVYKNKGNTTQSGTVNLLYNDAILDLVASNPVASGQTVSNLSWDFTNLQPFETREITLTLNVNSPTETPAVHSGDILNYTATITSVATDDVPNDNTFAFNQMVVNSFDPNDKTCLEGATIAPSEVGKYVHYMIRFENTGTFPAQNIVVKDMIDTNKFDVNSLVPIKGSHSFVTSISSGNKVEFIFENINLPFDDANNDGYVAFKIKTKPTLVNGDTFSNGASIYFDYNFPIVTNTATTTIQALSTQDFGFGQYFSLYPNPVKDVLNIETKQTIEVSSVNIYNQLGQLVLVVPNAQNVSKLDVSSLASGNYFIKINSDKGTSNTKFVKI